MLAFIALRVAGRAFRANAGYTSGASKPPMTPAAKAVTSLPKRPDAVPRLGG
jgi:hypothetical protein